MAQIQVSELLSEVMQITRECPTVTAVAAYVSAARMLCNRSRWLLGNAGLSTEAAGPVYTLTPPDAFTEVIGIQAASITDGAGKIKALTESFSGTWDPNPANDVGDGVPDFYQYVPEGRIGLRRTPAGIYALVATVVVQPLRNAVSIDARLVSSWDYALQAGALGYLLALSRTPWVDKVEARAQDGLFRGYINQATSSALRGFNGGAMPTDAYGANTGALRTGMQPI